MNNFKISNFTTEIVLAFSYSPTVLSNSILERKHTGLLYVEKGEYLYSYDNYSFIAKAGSLVYLPTDSLPYKYKILSKDTITHQIEVDIIDSKLNKPFTLSNHPLLIDSIEQISIKKAFEIIITYHKNTDYASCFSVYSKIFNILSICANATLKTFNLLNYSKITPAINYINENYKTKIDIQTLAELCYLSESQLRRLFIKELKITPIEYKNQLILNDAIRLLNAKELTVTEIADVLGFCDIYAFSHFFTKEKGVSPTAYKNSK